MTADLSNALRAQAEKKKKGNLKQWNAKQNQMWNDLALLKHKNPFV